MEIFGLLVALISLTGISPTSSAEQSCAAYTAFVVLDGSQSISLSNFIKMKHAANNFVTSSLEQNNRNRIGVIIYSDDVVTTIEASSNATSIIQQLTEAGYPRSGTATDEAIKKTKELLLNDIPSNQKIMIVVTDGVSNRPPQTAIEAKEAHLANITLITVGIDELHRNIPYIMNMFQKELNAIASSPEYVVSNGTFEGIITSLASRVSTIIQQICIPDEPVEYCTDEDEDQNSCCCRYCDQGEQSQEGGQPGCWCCERGNVLNEKQLENLGEVYDFVPGEFGPFIFAANWHSDDCCYQPPTNAYLIVLNAGICGRWAVWQEDRFYHIHEGKAFIDKISPSGELVTECLGSPVNDPSCNYVVRIPATWLADIRVEGNLAVLTSVIIHGNNRGGRNYGYEEMLEKHSKYTDIIKLTEKCYQF